MDGEKNVKLEKCLAFIRTRLESHKQRVASLENPPPFFLGVNGLQGAGKTTLVKPLLSALSSDPYNLPTVAFSLDDFYLPHPAQKALASANAHNPLLQHRGQPGTHDVDLGSEVFNRLKRNETDIPIPSYDKSAFDGEGDRAPRDSWLNANPSTSPAKVKIVIFEGWCLGFRKRGESAVREAWEDAVRRKNSDPAAYSGALAFADINDILDINRALSKYDTFTDHLDALIHLDAQDIHFVYDWRQEQERNLRLSRGKGMTEQQVKAFVNAYYPSYELYVEPLRNGVFLAQNDGRSSDPLGTRGRQLRLVLNKDRNVTDAVVV